MTDRPDFDPADEFAEMSALEAGSRWEREAVADPVDLRVASILYAGARRAHDYTPADERPERVEEEQADEE